MKIILCVINSSLSYIQQIGFYITICLCGVLFVVCIVGTVVEVRINTNNDADSPNQKVPAPRPIPMNATASSWTEFDKQPLLISEALEPAPANIFLRILACFSLHEGVGKVSFSVFNVI